MKSTTIIAGADGKVTLSVKQNCVVVVIETDVTEKDLVRVHVADPSKRRGSEITEASVVQSVPTAETKEGAEQPEQVVVPPVDRSGNSTPPTK